VPKPRAHLTRYHGVFAPASPDRVPIVPSTRSAASTERGEAAAVIERVLEQLGRDAGSVDPAHPSRAPPERDTSL
jgi:hypothetical protein